MGRTMDASARNGRHGDAAAREKAKAEEEGIRSCVHHILLTQLNALHMHAHLLSLTKKLQCQVSAIPPAYLLRTV